MLLTGWEWLRLHTGADDNVAKANVREHGCSCILAAITHSVHRVTKAWWPCRQYGLPCTMNCWIRHEVDDLSGDFVAESTRAVERQRDLGARLGRSKGRALLWLALQDHVAAERATEKHTRQVERRVLWVRRRSSLPAHVGHVNGSTPRRERHRADGTPNERNQLICGTSGTELRLAGQRQLDLVVLLVRGSNRSHRSARLHPANDRQRCATHRSAVYTMIG